VVTGGIENEQRDQREDCQPQIASRKLSEETPGSTGVAPVNEFEEPVHDDNFLAVGEPLQHRQFCQVVGRENGSSDQRHPFCRSQGHQ
jgi:hypothetical protein